MYAPETNARPRGRLSLTILASGLLATVCAAQDLSRIEGTAAEDPAPQAQPAQSPQHEPVLFGDYFPSTTHTLIRLRGIERLSTTLKQHALGVAFEQLRAADSRLVRSLEDFAVSITKFAEAHGIAAGIVETIIGTDTRLAFFADGGKQTYLIVLPLGEHATTVSMSLDARATRLKTRAKEGGTATFEPIALADRNVWKLPSPGGFSGVLYASVVGPRLLLSGSLRGLATGVDLQEGRGAPISGDADFTRLVASDGGAGEKDGGHEAWLTAFARPTAILDLLAPAGTRPEWLTALGLGRSPGICYRSTLRAGVFEDRVVLLLPEGGEQPLPFAGQEPPAADYSVLVPNRSRRYVAASIRPKQVFELLAATRARLPGLGEVDTFLAKLRGIVTDGEPDDVYAALGTQVLLVFDGPAIPGGGAVFRLGDAFGMKSILSKIAWSVRGGSGAEKGIPHFKLEGAGCDLHLAIDDFYLYASPKPEGLATLLEGRTKSAADPDIAALFAGSHESTWLIASDEPRLLVDWVDPEGELGLAPLADHLARLGLRATRTPGRLSFTTRSETGLAHVFGTAVARVLPRFVEVRTLANESKAWETLDRILAAERRFMGLAAFDLDDDGRGEAGSMTQLVEQALLDETVETDAGTDIATYQGYGFRVLRPKDTDDAEVRFLVVAWPIEPGISGRTCLAADETGAVSSHAWLANLDPAKGPTDRQLFAAEAFRSELKSSWRATRTIENNDTREPTTPEAGSTELALDSKQATRLLDVAMKRKKVETIRSLLEHEDPIVAARAAHYLGDLKDKESTPTLARLAKKSDSAELRQRAARGLALIGDPRGMSSLIECLSDDDGTVRLFAATGLMRGKPAGALDALIALVDGFEDDEAGDRTQALLTLHDIGDTSCLIRLAGASAGGPTFQQALVYCFQDLSPKLEEADEIEVLVRALESPNKSLRKYAIERVAAAGHDAALPALTEHLPMEDRDMQPLVETSIAALVPPSSMTLEKISEKLDAGWKKVQGLYHRLDDKPQWMRYSILGSPAVLLLLILMVRRSRTSGRRRRAEARAEALRLASPSSELTAHDDED